jgi:3-phenylpropionate/cinnamic acid dioxygenase small subunit
MASMAEERIAAACTRFLYRESELLDRRRFDDWLALIDRQIDYRIPVRTDRMAEDGDGFSAVAHFMKEDLGTLTLRVRRLDSAYAWAENPPTRTRRLVSNVRVDDAESQGVRSVTSNFAVYCYRGDNPVPVVLTGERQDILAGAPDALRLRRRLVLLDSTVLGMESLSIFL